MMRLICIQIFQIKTNTEGILVTLTFAPADLGETLPSIELFSCLNGLRVKAKSLVVNFYAPTASARWEQRAFGLCFFSVRPSLCPSEDQVKIFGQGRISRPINGSKLIFDMKRPAGIYKSYDLMTYISWSTTDFGLWPDYQG